MRPPKISVLMSVYNQRPYLQEAIDSILSQTLRDYEFVIVDDGSTDGSAEVLSGAARKDGRIHVIHNAKNAGLAAALCDGLLQCRGDLVARMDGDDISHPERLAIQSKQMSQEGLDVLGSGYLPHPAGWQPWRQKPRKVSAEHDDIVRKLAHANQICHPAVMMRKGAVLEAGSYDPRFRYAQDYDLWLRMSDRARFGNVAQPLLRMRRHSARSSGQANRGSHTQFSVVAVLNHFSRRFGLAELDPRCAPAEVGQRIVQLLGLCHAEPQSRRALVRHATRFARYCACPARERDALARTVLEAANWKERLKWQLYQYAG